MIHDNRYLLQLQKHIFYIWISLNSIFFHIKAKFIDTQRETLQREKRKKNPPPPFNRRLFPGFFYNPAQLAPQRFVKKVNHFLNELVGFGWQGHVHILTTEPRRTILCNIHSHQKCGRKTLWGLETWRNLSLFGWIYF